MYSFINTDIKDGDRLIIGIGDSYTQGIGAYTDETWRAHNGKIPVFTHDEALIKEQYEGSWVKQLESLLPGWKGLNLGVAGTGNRSAVKELYFHEATISKASEAIVVYMLSGFERFDFIAKEFASDHAHFEAMWPNYWDPGSPCPELWKAYADHVYTERFIAGEAMLHLLEAQMYCQAKGFRLLVVSAFDMRFQRKWFEDTFFKKSLLDFKFKPAGVSKEFVDQFDWSQAFYPRSCTTVVQLLTRLEGHDNEMANGRFYKHYSSMDYPSEYITNCVHPTRKGHAVIAEELAKEIKSWK